jgi:3-dehydroquinate synthase
VSAEASARRVRSVVVDLGERSYPIHIGTGISEHAGELIKQSLPEVRTCAVVTSEGVHKAHGRPLIESLEDQDLHVGLALVPDGEEAKTWGSAGDLVGDLLEAGLDRRSAVIAFGGGTIGDLAGFVASVYMRGVGLVQVPTTLLAQVDSSIGGKAAVNHPRGKNLIGAFHQPSVVISDQGLLGTLPRRELLSGLGEVVKHGVIADPGLFELAENDGERLMEADPDALEEAVMRSVAIKSRLVEMDERDNKGLRVILNYGHTLGHALETLSGHELRHGEAVALGMEFAARISVEAGTFKAREAERQSRTLEGLGFKLEPPRADPLELVAALRLDKKAVGSTINFILPTGIGSTPILKPVSEDRIIHILGEAGYG